MANNDPRIPALINPRLYAASDLRKTTLFEWVVFLVAVLILIAILGLGAKYDTLQFNILFLVILSLSCAMVFAFLPFHAEITWLWFKAGGTAAVFGLCMWQVVPYATANHQGVIQSLNETTDRLDSTLKERDTELQKLRSLIAEFKTSRDVSSVKSQTAKELLVTAGSTIGVIVSLLDTAIALAAAGVDNKDGPTCNLRAGQSLQRIQESKIRIRDVYSNIQSAKAAIP
jgi:hypothetical protein